MRADLACLREQARVDELAKMFAGSRAGDVRKECQFARGQRLTAHESGQHGGTRCVADECGDFNHVGTGNHEPFYRFATGGGKQ